MTLCMDSRLGQAFPCRRLLPPADCAWPMKHDGRVNSLVRSSQCVQGNEYVECIQGAITSKDHWISPSTGAAASRSLATLIRLLSRFEIWSGLETGAP